MNATYSTSTSESGGKTSWPDPDRFLMTAKRLVVENYNAHHDANQTDPLTMEDVYIIWFAKTLANWQAILASPVARGLLYMVSYNGARYTAHIDIYRKINNTKVQMERGE